MTAIARETVLIAVSFESMSPAGAIGPYGQILQFAVIRGESNEQSTAFEARTSLLSPEQEQRCWELKQHGFVVVEVPSDWRYAYTSAKQWQGKVIQQAWEVVHDISNRESAEVNYSGYDINLFRVILEQLNNVFPHGMTPMELRYQMNNE
jgi:hypothetical protein